MSAFDLPEFMVDPVRSRIWKRVMVRLGFLGMCPVDLAASIHQDDLREYVGDDGELSKDGTKKLRMYNIHLHQRLNGVRFCSDEHVSQMEAALGLREGALKRGRWVDMVKK